MPDNLSVPVNPQAEEFRKNHWTVDAGINSGQEKAGDVDEEQAKFLQKTEFVKEGQPA